MEDAAVDPVEAWHGERGRDRGSIIQNGLAPSPTKICWTWPVLDCVNISTIHLCGGPDIDLITRCTPLPKGL
jgi:hypothetical protein